MLRLCAPTTQTVKCRTGEKILLSVALKPTTPQHTDYAVEAWTSIHEPGGAPAAIKLEFLRKEGEEFFYSKEIPAHHAGQFTIKFRCRHKDQQYWNWLEEGKQHKTIELWVEPAWVYDAIVYNAFVRYFGAKEEEKDGKVKTITPGTFKDIKNELSKLKQMGINILYLNPVHMIGELYRNYNPHDLLPEYLQPGCPYSVKDYKSIDPELSFERKNALGAEHPFTEFRKLVDEAHHQGIRVVMDLVFNHAAHDAVFQRQYPEWFLYKDDICSLELPYIYQDEIKDGKPWGDSKHTFSPYDHGWWWRDAAQLNWNNIDQYPDFIMPKTAANAPPKNPRINEMYTYFRNVVNFWIREFGIDGFRCDVAYRVPLDFWRSCILEAQQTAREAHPANGSISNEIIFLAEDYHVAMKDLLEAGFTACYGDYSNKLQNLPDITGYLDYMYNIGSSNFPQGSLWFVFPECHDFHRNPEKIAKELREKHKDADLNANKSRWTMTACLPGVPMIFNGFEKIEWQPASLFSYSTIDWESDRDISKHIRNVNSIRHKEVCLQRGSYYYLHTSEGITPQSKLFSFARIHGKEAAIVVVNIDIVEQAKDVVVHLADALPIDYSKPYALTDLLTGKRYKRKGNELIVTLGPGEAHIFKVKQ